MPTNATDHPILRRSSINYFPFRFQAKFWVSLSYLTSKPTQDLPIRFVQRLWLYLQTLLISQTIKQMMTMVPTIPYPNILVSCLCREVFQWNPAARAASKRSNCKGPPGLPCAVTPQGTWPPCSINSECHHDYTRGKSLSCCEQLRSNDAVGREIA